MTSALIAVLSELAGVLDQLGLRFVVGGSLASTSWGEPRSTHDVDLLIDLREERIAELVAHVRERFYVDEDAVREAVRTGGAFNLIHLGLYQKADLFVAGASPLDAAQLATAVPRSLSAEVARTFPLTSAEVMVVRKLDWFRRTGEASDRQWRDVLAILRVQGARLDREAIGRLAERAGLDELWARARAQG